MKRIKPLLIIAGIVAAVVSLVRMRPGDDRPVDRGGWEPVEPS